jgi:arginyl-tRNA synthetase
MNIMLHEIREDLKAFGCTFDTWFSEQALYSTGDFKSALEDLKSKGDIYEKDGALWIRTSQYGDDKDRVIRKKSGDYTYFASDISYHLNKWKRGFSRAINIWGADHHGYIKRIKAVLKANGIAEDWLSVMLVQLVKLWEDGREIKMSKRTGQYVTLRELMDEVGRDAVRFVFLTKSHDSPLDFDINLVKKKDPDNPVYYVQYAHARICSIMRKAQDQGISLNWKNQDSVLVLIELDEEMALLRHIAGFPDLLDEVCRTLEPHRLTYYLGELASLFHKYFNLGNSYSEKRVITLKRDLTLARLMLVEAVRVVLKNGLSLLGVSAPDRM